MGRVVVLSLCLTRRTALVRASAGRQNSCSEHQGLAAFSSVARHLEANYWRDSGSAQRELSNRRRFPGIVAIGFNRAPVGGEEYLWFRSSSRARRENAIYAASNS